MKGNAVVSTMNFLENDLYKEDIAYVAGFELSWHMLQNKSILISGASFEGLSCDLFLLTSTPCLVI